MPWITLSFSDASLDIDKLVLAIQAFSDGEFDCDESDGRVSLGFYPGEGLFAHTSDDASVNIDAFTPDVNSLLQDLGASDIVVSFHIDLLY